jgi:cell division initiation protein
VSLSPDDIVSYEFRQQKVRGYDVAQVDDLLDRLADQVERTDRELDDLRRRLRESEARLAAALETETTLKRTLVTAQDAAERALAEAREQADELRETAERAIDEQLARAREEARTLVTDAQREARSELETAQQQRAAIEGRLASLRELEQRHRSSLERHLRAQLDELEQLARDQDAPSNSPAPDALSPRRPSSTPEPHASPAGPGPAGGHGPAAGHRSASDALRGSEGGPSPADHGLTVRVRGTDPVGGNEPSSATEAPAGEGHEVGSTPAPDGGEDEHHG